MKSTGSDNRPIAGPSASENLAVRIPNAYYPIIDLEETCSNDGTVPRKEMEIIEIGALMLNSRSFETESEFQTFVRPVRHPTLTRFCTEPTGITQEDLADAPGYADAVGAMKPWMYRFEDPLFCSWGDYDRNQFQQGCAYHGVAYPFRAAHLNLKAEFARALALPKKLGISGALTKLGLEFEGTHHRGLDDARNIARIVRRVCATA